MTVVRAVFVDLDDTFLAPDKSVPPENRALLDELACRGIDLVPCTGRHVGGVPEVLRAHPCVRYVVASNGGIVHDLRRGEDLLVRSIPSALVVKTYQAVAAYPVVFDCFADGRAYCEQARHPLFDLIDAPEGLRTYLKEGRTTYEGTVPELLPRIGPVTKISAFFTTDEGDHALRAAFGSQPELYYVQTSASNYEAMVVEANKGAALRWLAAHAGWDVAQTVAFGDNNNDVTMLQAAGDGVCMANGLPEVQALADHIAPPAQEGGVARYLEALWQ